MRETCHVGGPCAPRDLRPQTRATVGLRARDLHVPRRVRHAGLPAASAVVARHAGSEYQRNVPGSGPALRNGAHLSWLWFHLHKRGRVQRRMLFALPEDVSVLKAAMVVGRKRRRMAISVAGEGFANSCYFVRRTNITTFTTRPRVVARRAPRAHGRVLVSTRERKTGCAARTSDVHFVPRLPHLTPGSSAQQ